MWLQKDKPKCRESKRRSHLPSSSPPRPATHPTTPLGPPIGDTLFLSIRLRTFSSALAPKWVSDKCEAVRVEVPNYVT